MATCGNCKRADAPVAHVRECYAARYAARPGAAFIRDTAPAVGELDFANKTYTVSPSRQADSYPGVVAGMYALPASEGTRFYKVGKPEKGKWVGWIFLDALSGSPGSWRTSPIKASTHKSAVLNAIANDPAKAAGMFGRKYQICGRCSSPLTDPRSRAAGYGAICAEKLGWHYPTTDEALASLGETANN